MKRTGLRSVSKKRLASGEVSTGSTFRKRSSRSRPMTPGGTITRSPMKKKARPASEFNRIYGSKARVEWMKRKPCIACMLWPQFAVIDAGPSENAHTVTGGMGRKADANTIVPLCHKHHMAFDLHAGLLGEPLVRSTIVAAAEAYDRSWRHVESFKPVHRARPNKVSHR